ncbi:MAG TPA: HAMP domain-containing sensor histidine kinase [Jatrophihabitans sp.]|nr:HAMP domain-containing sensor histidine kinase [Jatrophihabitans sp.]
MNHLLAIVATALLWGAGAAVLVWLLTWPLRHRSQAGVLISLALVATVASVAAVYGNTRAMFLAADDAYATVTVAVVAGLLATVAAARSARTFARDNRSIHQAVLALRAGGVPAEDGHRLSGELQKLHNELAETGRTLAESRERERTLAASRRELVAWVSHDLRTPLAGLRAMAEALEDGVASSPERYHKQIRIEVDRLAGMVDDLFEISRLQAGTVTARADRVSLDDLVSDCVAALEPVAGLQGVRLIGRATSPAEVVGNGAELNRALTNLLINAIRHTRPAGTVEIVLRHARDASAAVAELTVSDECGGIAAEDLARVFEVGFRGEPARTHQPGLGAGAGLGLAITQGIVAAHAGSVQVHNAGGGCAFTVRLPLAC